MAARASPANNILEGRALVPPTSEYHDGSFSATSTGKRVFMPLAVAIVAISMTDLMFALDSIPASSA